MKAKKIKIFSLVGLFLTIVGCIVFTIGFCLTGCDIYALSNVKIKMLSYTESENANIHTIKIDYNTANVTVVFGDTLKIDYPQQIRQNGKEKSTISLTENDGVLFLDEDPISSINIFNFVFPKLTLTLPADRVFTLDIETTTGDISIPSGGKYKALSLETTTGDITVKKSECEEGLCVDVTTGNVKITEFTGTTLTAESTTGNLSLNDCTATEKIHAERSTGNLSIGGTITTAHFYAKASTGDLRGKGVIDAAVVDIKATTGNISIQLKGKHSDYKTLVDTTTGDSNIGDSLDGTRTLTIKTTTGNISISFAE